MENVVPVLGIIPLNTKFCFSQRVLPFSRMKVSMLPLFGKYFDQGKPCFTKLSCIFTNGQTCLHCFKTRLLKQIYKQPHTTINVSISLKICLQYQDKQFSRHLYTFPQIGTLVSITKWLLSKCNKIFFSCTYILIFPIKNINLSTIGKIFFHQ